LNNVNGKKKFKSKEYLHVISNGILESIIGIIMTNVEREKIEAMKLKDLKVKNYLFQVSS